jgi:hypothetical protein
VIGALVTEGRTDDTVGPPTHIIPEIRSIPPASESIVQSKSLTPASRTASGSDFCPPTGRARAGHGPGRSECHSGDFGYAPWARGRVYDAVMEEEGGRPRQQIDEGMYEKLISLPRGEIHSR